MPMRLDISLHVLASALWLCACGEASDGHDRETVSEPASTTSACSAIVMDEAKDAVQYAVPVSVPAKDEREYCMLVMLDRDLNLNWSDGRYTTGSHHALLSRTHYKGAVPTTTVTGETIADATKPHRCQSPSAVWDVAGIIAGGRSLAAIEQNLYSVDPGRKGVLPEDVAYPLKKGDVLVLNFHMINTSDQPIEACYKINLHGIPDAQVRHEAGTLFFYNPAITLPGKGTSTARMACPLTRDITLAYGVSHMHARGDGYTAKLLDRSPADPSVRMVQELYSGKRWDDPPMRMYEPALQLKQGQWIDYECHYTNHEAREVSQGNASTDEMCMFIGAYWPFDRDLETCEQSGDSSVAHGLMYGSGTGSGEDFMRCFWQSPKVLFGTGDDPNRYATQSCFTQTCPNASAGLLPYALCAIGTWADCQAECESAADSPEQGLVQCVAACLHGGVCKAEFDALAAATCT